MGIGLPWLKIGTSDGFSDECLASKIYGFFFTIKGLVVYSTTLLH